MDVNGRTGGTNLIEKLSTAATATLDVGVELFVGRAAYTFFDVQIYWGLSTPDTSTIHSIDRTMFQLQVRRRLVTYPVYFCTLITAETRRCGAIQSWACSKYLPEAERNLDALADLANSRS